MAPTGSRQGRVAAFYAGRNVLVTGASGFLGMALLQKTLSACPDVRAVYLILRQKRAMGARERLDKILSDPLFDTLRKQNPNFKDKIHPLLGDIGAENLGLRTEDRILLIEKINVIFHVAATIRFEEKLRSAVNINVRGTRDMINMCKEMKDLKCMVYVSTAYSFCPRKRIGEWFFSPPMSPDTMIKMANELDEETLDNITPKLIGQWPNTYTYTKAIAEDYINTYHNSLPIGVYRPSIVIPTYRDPISNWMLNINGPIGMAVGSGLGLQHIIHADPNNKPDMIPVDYCINSLMVAAMDIARQNEEYVPTKNIIYNYIATVDNSMTLSKYINTAQKNYNEKFNMTMSPVFTWFTPCLYWYYILMFFTHVIPGLILDGLALASGRKAQVLGIVMKMHKYNQLINYFLFNEWDILNVNLMNLWDEMSAVDKKVFPYNMNGFDWEDYYKHYAHGIKQFIMKDKMDAQSVREHNLKYEKIVKYFRIVGITTVLVLSLFLWLYFSEYLGSPIIYFSTVTLFSFLLFLYKN